MTLSRLCRLVLACSIACAPPLPAQNGLEWMTSRAWRIQDGLPDQVIQAIAQTPDHYLWLGTKLGLVRFDGYHFLDYGGDLAPALHDFGVDCILVARDASLWLGTQGGGVVHLSPGTGRAQTYGPEAGLASEQIRALYEDSARRIWAGTDHGIYRFNTARFEPVDEPSHSLNFGVQVIIGDNHGGVWAGGSRLLHFPAQPGNRPQEEVTLPRQPTSMRIRGLTLAPDGTLWIGTLGGLFRTSPGAAVTKEPRIPGGILSLHMDTRNQLWVGTLGDGLYLIDQRGVLSHASAPDRLASNAVLALAEDLERNLWVGTQSGLTRFSATGMRMTRIPGAIDSEFGSVSVDTDQSLWVCSRQLIHLRGGLPEVVNLPSVRGVTIRSVMRDRSGDFWVGTLGSGAYRIAPGGSVDHFTSIIGTNYIRGFLDTPQDGVWIASDGGVANWRAGNVTSFQNAPGSPHAAVTAMAIGAPGQLWVGTDNGLSLLQHGVFVSTPAAQALGRHLVWALHHSSDGALWIGTEGGLFRWSNGQLHRFRLEAEMGGAAILTILEDARGRIWLGGPTTVLRSPRAALEQNAEGTAHPEKFTPETFSVALETGAELSGGAASTAALDGAGGAWFATNEGPLHIQAGDQPVDGDPPPIMLGPVSVDGRRIAVDGPILLQPSARTLEIAATPIALSARSGLQLRRRLIGFDSDWQSTAPLLPATYTNLPPGNYIYRIEAGWKGSPVLTALEIPIRQQAHFYRRPLFLCASAALLLLLIWIGHRLRVRQVTLRFRLVGEERSRVAREMHDTVVQSCIGISSLLEAVAIRQPDSSHGTEQSSLLNSAREQIAVTIVEARHAIWNLRHPPDEGGLAFALRSMLDRITAPQATLVQFESEGAPRPLDSQTQHELLMTTREALHNAVLHATPTHIHLGLTYAVDHVTIRIRDDGKGFEPPNPANTLASSPAPDPHQHFGLLGMRERMERVGGSCTIVSTAGSGSLVTLNLPLRRHLRKPQETR